MFWEQTCLKMIWQIFIWSQLAISIVDSSYLHGAHICGPLVCHDGDVNKFNFNIGVKYNYNYNLIVDTMFDVASKNSSTLNINITFSLEFNSQCEAVLKISDAVILEGYYDSSEDPSLMFFELLSANPLRFYFDDGKIGEVCPHKNDSNWVVNFKKGILSSLQNTMVRLDLGHYLVETDINGKCTTEYKLKELKGTSLILSKVKDIFSCTDRAQLNSFIPTSNYVFQNRNHKWTPLESNHSCVQYVDHKVVTKVVCQERHSFLPIYNQKDGATTMLNYEIELIDEENLDSYEIEENKELGSVTQRESLLYNHKSNFETVGGELEESTKLITSLCHLNSEEFQPDSAEVFNKLIHQARYLPYLSLVELFNRSDTLCASGRKHMLDALPHLRSSAAVSLMAELLVHNTLPLSIAKEFLFTISFHSRPHESTISSVNALLLNPIKGLESNILLAVSSLVHFFCKFSPNCEKNHDVIQILRHFEKIVENRYQYGEELQKVMYGLKAIGNAGVYTPGILSKLQECIQNPGLPLDLQVVAIEAQRRFPCEVGREFLLNLFINQTSNSQLRISAYLQIMRCPSYYVITGVKKALEKEEVNQVGSFVWSHLQNQKKSSMPSRIEIQAMLQDQELKKKFDNDFRQFSRNYEQSFYLNDYGLGGFVEYNIIFSHVSYIPVTINANISVSVFGELVNIAEVTINIQGFEYYMEKLFWNSGIFSKASIDKILRLLRSVTTNLKEQVERLPNPVIENFINPKVSMSLKLFGNEVKYLEKIGIENVNSAFNNLNPLTIVKNFLSGQELDVVRSFMFIDVRYVAPLSIGFPLVMDAVGTTTVKFNLAGFFNITAFTTDGHLNIDAKLKPSMAMNTLGSMGVDAFLAGTSIKLHNKLFTSTALEGKLNMKGYKLLTLMLDLPMKKSEIFSMENQLEVMNGTEIIPLSGITPRRLEDHMCNFPLLDDVLGLQLCTQYLLPNSTMLLESPMLIFTSPIKVRIFLDKSDPSIKKYKFEYKMVELENKSLISVEFDTPEATVERSLKAAVFIDNSSQNYSLIFQSAINQIKAEGKYLNTPQDKSLHFVLDINGHKHIDIALGLKKIEVKHGYTYEPKLLFQINNKRVADLSGFYKWVEKSNVSQCEVNLSFKTNRFVANINGYVSINDVSIYTIMKTEYQFEEKKGETNYLRVELNLANRSNLHMDKYMGLFSIISSAYPQINCGSSINLTKAEGRLDLKVNFETNPEIDNNDTKLNINFNFNIQRTIFGSKSNLILEIIKPDNQVDIKFILSHNTIPSGSESHATIRYAKDKEIKVKLNITNTKESILYFRTELNVELPGNLQTMKVIIHLIEKTEGEFDIGFMGVWFSGHTLSIHGSYQHRSTMVITSHNIKLIAKSELFTDIIFIGRLHISEREYKLDLQMDNRNVKYGVRVDHVNNFDVELQTLLEVKYDQSTYAISNEIDLVNNRIIIDIHLDQYRDIRISLRGIHNSSITNAGFDIQWDVNRVPSPRIVFTLELLKKAFLNYDCKFILNYPGRIITGLLELNHRDVNCMGTASLMWSQTERIHIVLFTVYDLINLGKVSIRSELTTPFENWRSTYFEYELFLLENSMESSAVIKWQEIHSLNFNLSSNYIISEGKQDLRFRTLLNSTIPEINSVQITLYHLFNISSFSSGIIIQSSPVNVISAKSSGFIQNTKNLVKYSVYMGVYIPYKNWTGSCLTLNTSLDKHNTLVSEVNFIFNDKQYTSSLKGALRTFNESKIILHITTPYEKYSKIIGRFLYSASKKHFLVDIKGPNPIDVGVEVKYLYTDLSNFDLLLHAMTGISFVNNILIVGQRNNKSVDLRTGWNAIMVGIIGKSIYESWNHFEYKGILYTPIEGFKESGITVKFDNTDSIDFEARAGVAQYKVGFKFNASNWKKNNDFFTKSQNKSIFSPFQPVTVENPLLSLKGMFELDTIVYPMMSGTVVLAKQNHIYHLMGNFLIAFVEIQLQDHLNFTDILRLSNHLLMKTNNTLLSELESNLDISGVHTSSLLLKLNAAAISNNCTEDFDMETSYLFRKSNEDSDSGSEGLYKVNYKLHTPFQFLDHFYLDFNLQSQEDSYETDMYLDLKDVRVGVNASIDICNEGNYFFTQTEISISSPVLMLPILNISITKDFNEVENKVIATLNYRYDTEIKYAAVNSYAVLGSWHFSSNKLLKLSGHLLTPFPKFDELKAHLYYSSDDIQQLYSVESSFKYSSDFVIKTRGNVYGSNIVLFIESTIENFRLLEVNSTLLQQGGGYYSIEPVFSRHSVPTMQGRMTMSEDVPLHLQLNIYDKNKKQIAGLSMEVRKKISNPLKGFNIFLVIRCKNISVLNLESDVSMSPENVTTYQVIARSEIPGYSKINFTLSLLPPEDSLSMVKLDGCTDLKFLSTDFNVICTYWLEEKEGFLKTDLKSNISTASSYISWTLDYPHSMRGFANATYKYQGTTKGFSSQLFFISPNAGLDNIFAGADFSTLNKKWWFNSNVSLLAPSLSNIGFTSHLRVPHTHNIHTLVGKLYYTQDLKVLDQMLEYSTKTPNAGFKTVGKVNITDDSFDSVILLMTGENRSMFLHDMISARRKEVSYEVVNIFKSSFIQDELTLKLLYERQLVNHILRVNMFYPQTIPVVKAFVHYETMNNLFAFLNCTVPFSDVPKISAQIGAVTNFRKYQRQGQLQWHNRTALFNYTHFISKISNEAENIHSNITDGVLIVDFPLATRHVGKVVYTYEDYEKFSSGYSKMVYNQEEILNGNFTYRSEATDSSKENDISIYINNSYIPLGLKYFSNLSKGIGKSGTSSERKKGELFRLNNSTAFNISGELIIDKLLFEDRIKLIIHHANANRTLNIDTVKTPNKTLQALANLHLKPNMWFNSKFVISTNDTEYAFGKNVMFSLSYPNREFIVQGTYLKPSDRLAIEIEICPNNLLEEKHTIGGTFTWIHSLEDMDYHKALVLISHPSFEKNVTLIGELKLKDWVLLNINSSLEYAKEEKKKVTLSGMFKHNQTQPGKDYSLHLYANHDASSLNLDLNSYLKYRHLFFNFKKDLKYTRSYLPLQFWISMLNLDGIDHVFELETHSLRELIQVHADYVKEGPFHKINSSAIKGSNNKISGKFYLNLDDMDSRLLVNLTPDALEQLHMQAKYTDNRHVFFQIWRIYEEVFLSDVLLDGKLNHSRLLFGTLAWRPQLKQEVTVAFHSSVAFIWSYIKESTEFWTEYVKSETIESVNDIWSDAKPMLKDFLDDVKNVDRFKEDIEYFRKILNESYNANEFYMQDVYNIYLLMAEEIAFKDKMSSLPKIVNELWNTLGETGETIRQSIIWLTETIQRMYDKLLNFFSGFLNGETSQQLSQSFSSFIESYDKFIKDLHVSFIDYMESLWDQSANIISNYWKTAIQVIEPTFIELVHYIETVFWTGSKKILNFMYQKQNQIMNTPFFMRESNISQDLDKFYKDLTKRDFFSNLSKYTSMILGIIKDKYFKVVPFGYELKEVVSEIYNDIKVLYKLPAISFTIETSHSVYLKLLWFLEFFQIGDKIQKSIPFLYHQLTEVSHDAIENDMKNRESKTKFIFDIRSGFIHLTQKLPIPWHSFNDTPNFKEIPEYKMLTRVQSWFETSNLTWQHFYYKYAYLRDFNNWIPPFRGQAYIIGDKHFITFDKKFKTYEGPCSYLLAKDFVNNNFALVLKSNGEIADHHSIVLLVRGNSIEIDHIDKKLKVQDLPMNLPFNLNGTYLFWENDIITVERKEEFILTCNLKYAICCFDIVGWYFGKTAGILGTMDNEPTTDALSSHGEEEGNTSIFMKSWSLDTESCPKFSFHKGYQVSTYDNLYEKCNHLFVYKSSPFNYCFDVVNPEPYKELCYMKKQDRNEMCTAAVTYVQSCHLLNVPLRIPYYCVNCSLQNGSYFQEGKFIEIKSDVGSYSADIVFIIEAKECNKEISEKRHLPVFLSILTKELQLLGIENSRFALVTFGGDGLFNRPNNILMDNHAFADSKTFLDALRNIEIGNGDGDIFAAIKYASKMQFRLGASTVFILLPCSSCDISNQTVDFSVLDDVLIERSISLHVLMNKDFGFGKAKMIKNFFGFDSEAAYTKNDLKHFKGNKALLKHVKVRKSLFGYCTPLALNTNGSLFTAKKMENSSLTSVKKFLGVFAKRVAKSSVPQTCQMCECSADDYGIDFIECYPCDAPHPSLADIGSSSRFNLLQSLDESNNSELNISL